MQPALLSELFPGHAAEIEETLAAERPISGIMVETVEAPGDVVLAGNLFGAPVLDGARRAAGYRGFLVVAHRRRLPQARSEAAAPQQVPEPQAIANREASAPRAPGCRCGARAGNADAAGAGDSAARRGEDAGCRAASAGAQPRHAGRWQERGSRGRGRGHMAAAGVARGRGRSAVGALPGTWSDPYRLAEARRGTTAVECDHAASAACRSGEGEGGRGALPHTRRARCLCGYRKGARSLEHAAAASAPAAVPSPARPQRKARSSRRWRRRIGTTSDPEPAAEASGAHETAAPAGPAAAADAANLAEALLRDPYGLTEAVREDLVTVIDRLPVGVLVHRDGTAVAVNRTLLDLLGHASLEEFAAHGDMDKLFVDHGEEEGAHPGVAIRTRDGEVIAVDARCQAIKWRGEAATLLSLRRSIASQTKALEASYQVELNAKQSEIDDLRVILEGAIDGVVTIDALGRILAVNSRPSGCSAIGRQDRRRGARRASRRRGPSDGVDGARRGQGHGRQARAAGSARDHRARARRQAPALSMRLFAAGANRSAARFYAVFADLAAAKVSEAELIESRAHGRGSTQKSDSSPRSATRSARRSTRSSASPEVMMEERFGPIGNERYKEYLRDIHVSGAHLMSLINDLLDLSKIEAGKLDLTFEAVRA